MFGKDDGDRNKVRDTLKNVGDFEPAKPYARHLTRRREDG